MNLKILMFRQSLALALACLMLVTACVPYDARRQEFAAPGVPIFKPSSDPKVTSFRIDGAHSRVTLLVGKTGRLSNLGHNHVIVSEDLTGIIYRHQELPRSSFIVLMPVASLILDREADRERAGPEYAKPVSENDIRATRNNLLGEPMLAADRYPVVKLISESITGELPHLNLAINLTIKETTRQMEVPVTVRESNGTLQIVGTFSLRQTDFGLKPFSLFGGVIAVTDEVKVLLDIQALAKAPAPDQGQR